MDRVFIFDGGGELMSLPAEWTSLSGEDPFVVVAVSYSGSPGPHGTGPDALAAAM
jgi:hypothetical protein